MLMRMMMRRRIVRMRIRMRRRIMMMLPEKKRTNYIEMMMTVRSRS